MSQEEYNERQRAKREQEFAPPSSYKINVPDVEEESGGLHFTTKKKRKPIAVENIPIPSDPTCDIGARTKKAKVSERQGTEIPPPISYHKTTAVGKSKKLDLSDSIEMGLNRLRHAAEMKSRKKEPFAVEII